MAFLNSLPKSFASVLPLYTGVELILLYAMINKMCGVFGLLSLITGHPIDLFQWVYYLSSTIILIVYLSGLKTVRTPTMNRFSLIVFVYVLDSFIGCLFTAYFSWFWFAEQSKVTLANDSTTTTGAGASGKLATGKTTSTGATGKSLLEVRDAIEPLAVDLIKRAISTTGQAALSSDSASEAYELMMTVFITLWATGLRIYFTLIMLSFFREMRDAAKFDSKFRITSAGAAGGRFSRIMNTLETNSYKLLNKLV